MGPSLAAQEAPVTRSRVGIALSGAAILLACGGVAAAAAGAPLSAGLASADPTVSVSPTPTPSPSATDDDGAGTGSGDGSDTDEGDDSGTAEGDDSGTDAGGVSPEAGTGGVGPDAAGPAHHGLCTAWSHVQGTPGKAADSTAFRNLQAVGCDDVTPRPEPDAEEPGTDAGDSGATPPTGQGKGQGRTKHSSSTTTTTTTRSTARTGQGSKRTGGSHGRH